MAETELITGKLIEQGALVAFMLLVIFGLCWFIKWLLAELKETRSQSLQALINNTQVMTELKGIINALVSK
jgi:lipid-A-disaccharide synthase-like uncharacterized protein